MSIEMKAQLFAKGVSLQQMQEWEIAGFDLLEIFNLIQEYGPSTIQLIEKLAALIKEYADLFNPNKGEMRAIPWAIVLPLVAQILRKLLAK
jgi:hypothetical protein